MLLLRIVHHPEGLHVPEWPYLTCTQSKRPKTSYFPIRQVMIITLAQQENLLALGYRTCISLHNAERCQFQSKKFLTEMMASQIKRDHW